MTCVLGSQLFIYLWQVLILLIDWANDHLRRSGAIIHDTYCIKWLQFPFAYYNFLLFQNVSRKKQMCMWINCMSLGSWKIVICPWGLLLHWILKSNVPITKQWSGSLVFRVVHLRWIHARYMSWFIHLKYSRISLFSIYIWHYLSKVWPCFNGAIPTGTKWVLWLQK